jgi:class 3 adenylate cyclase/tetratricopeptide (TPR) repeat protein
VNCPSCGFSNVAAARFCSGCGRALDHGASAPPEAERRHVFVLFSDLVGSTPLSQRLDAEDLRDAIAGYQRRCEAVVLRHGGFVAQYLGDGIEVYFGYPQAHEDDASRVIRCALEIVEAIRQLAAATNLDLQVRVGIHSGRVVIGTMGGSERPVRLAVGDAPNIAARVQSAAAPGEVVVTEAAWRLLPGTFEARSMGLRQLKGVERPLELFKVVASGGQAAGRTLNRTPFIGRTCERDSVREVWGRARTGAPQFLLLTGEPGIGKSRFLEVIQSEIVDERSDILVARCSPVTTDTALYPVLELIGLRLGFEGASHEDRVDRIAKRMIELGINPKEAVPLLAEVLSLPVNAGIWPMPNLSSARARQRTMDILIAAFHALARRGPVLLTIEDLHWADPSTLELLRQLIASPHSASLMALLTARPEFAPTWSAAKNVAKIELDALDPANAEALIRKVARDKPLPPDLLWQIRERAAGNPLFLEEVTRSVMESGAVVEQERSWELVGPLSSDMVPASMEASIMARIDRLQEARGLFQLGATLGREFTEELLMAVAELPEESVRSQLKLMLDSGLIFRHANSSVYYAFKHALIRDAAYNSLVRATRQRHHARIAEVLAERFPEVSRNRPELLAHHLSGAGVYAQAATHWRAAGEIAARRSAVREAVVHFRRALADLEKLPLDVERMGRELPVLTALAPVLTMAFGWASPEVAETSQRAIDLGTQLGAAQGVFTALWALWTNQFVAGRLDAAMDTAGKVLAMAEAADNPMLVSIGRNASCYTRYYRGEYDQALVEARIGLVGCPFEMDMQIAQAFQGSATTNMLISKGSALWMQGRQDEGLAVVNDMIAHAQALQHIPSIATALASAMFFSFYDRDWKRMFALADEVYDLSRAEGFAMWTANAGMHRGRARIGLGDAEVGLAELLEWGALFRQTGSGILEGSTTSMMSEALHMAGHSEEALVVSGEGERRAEIGAVRVMTPEIFRTRGNILRDLGRLQEADEAYRLAAANARAQGALSLELRALTSLLDLRISLGRPGALPAKLRRVLSGMQCKEDRPDIVAAQETLARVRSTKSLRKRAL